MSQKRYRTKLLTSKMKDYYQDPPYRGKNFIIQLEPQKRTIRPRISSHDRRHPLLNIVIYSQNEKSAQKVLDLITYANCLVNDYYFDIFHDRNYLDLPTNKPPKDIEERIRRATGPYYGDYQYACIAASKLSYKKQYQFALHKYILSSQCYYINPHDLDPSEWYSEPFVLDSIDYIVRCSYAIVLAYSVLEELGLEIRASNNNPAFINGNWNPRVRNDLQDRLIKAGVNISEKALWVRRGTSTKIERERPLPIIRKTEWASDLTRDCYIDLIDAIARASWLRSKVSAHKSNDLTYSINYYEVSNIQYIARRLILERIGLWRLWQNPNAQHALAADRQGAECESGDAV